MKKYKLFSDTKSTVAIVIILLLLIFITISVVYEKQQKNAIPTVEVKPNNCYDKTITVVADYDYEPYSFFDDENRKSGHDVEFIYSVANEMHVNVDLQFMSWAEAIKAISDGKADVIMGLEYANEESDLYNLTMPFNTDQFLCFGKKDFQYINELDGKKVATLDEDKNYDYLFNYAVNVPVNSYSEAFEKLEHNEVDYVICRYAVGRRIVAKNEYIDISAVGPTLISSQLCMGVREDETQLCKEIDKAIQSLSKNGYTEELSDKWLGRYVQILSFADFVKQNQNYFIIGISAIVILFVSLLLLVFSKTRKAKELSEVNEKCIKILSEQNENTIFAWDNIFKEIVMVVNFEMISKLANGAKKFSDLVDYVHKDDIWIYKELMEKTHAGETVSKLRFRIAQEDDKTTWLEVTTAAIKDKSGNVVRIIGSFDNVNDRVINENKLKKRAELDLLTGVYNKVTAESLISDILSDEEMHKCALYIVDIDNLKYINDNFGHLYGDMVIKRIANDLKNSVRKGDIVGRIGGDEFILLIRDCSDTDMILARASLICKNFNFVIEKNNEHFMASVSIGISLNKEGDTFIDLYKKADVALYEVKKNQKNGYAIFKE